MGWGKLKTTALGGWVSRKAQRARGNVFAILFGAVALTGVLATVTMNLVTGPISTLSRVTQKNMNDNNIEMNIRVLINTSSTQSGCSSGDCDSDGVVEPWPSSSTGYGATAGGGGLPTSLGLNLTDPWGSSYGYCVWDHGATTNSTGRLAGDTAQATYSTKPVIAIISRGPNKNAETTCNTVYAGTSPSWGASGDDVVRVYTYATATASSGGLWTINAADANKAELAGVGGTAVAQIERQSTSLPGSTALLRVGGIAPMLTSGANGNMVSMIGAFVLDHGGDTSAPCDSTAKAGGLRYNSSTGYVELCNGTAWSSLNGVPAGSNGQIQFNSSGNFGADSQFVWDATNHRLGIGTASPASALSVVGSTVGQFQVGTATKTLYGGADSTGPWIGSSTNDSLRLVTNGTAKVTVDASGNVGIGKTPSVPLDVNGAIAGSSTITAATTVTAGTGITSTTGNIAASSGNVSASGTVTAGTSMSAGTTVTAGTGVTATTGNITASSGNVSASGTVTAGTSISAGTTVTAGSNVYTALGTAALPSRSYTGDTNTGTFSPTADTWAVSTGGTERMRVQPNGRVGIGTTNPSSELEVVGTITATNFVGNGSGLTGIAYTETDPQVGTITASNWCKANAGATAIDCTVATLPATAVSAAGVTGNVQYNNGGLFSADTNFNWDGTNHRLGIGTASPTQPVDVVGAVTSDSVILKSVTGATAPGGVATASVSGTAGYIPKYSASTTMTNSVLYETGGNVGIGTTSPSYSLDVRNSASNAQLHISGSSANDDGAYLLGLTNGAYLSAGASFNGTAWVAKNAAASIFSSTGGGFNFFGNTGLTVGSTYTPTASLTILSSGNVGIGTTSPAYKLDVNGTARVDGVLSISGGSSGAWPYLGFNAFWNGNGSGGWTNTSTGYSAMIQTAQDNGRILFSTNGASQSAGANFSLSERMTILQNGNVGIGTTSPGQKLDVNGYLRVRSTNGEGGTIELQGNNGVTTWVENLNGVFRVLNSPWNFEMFKVDQSGNAYAAAFYYTSDRRLKKEIVYADNDAALLDGVVRLKPAHYRFRANPETLHFGLIAQDVEQLFPEYVTTAQTKEGYKAVDYAGLTVPLIGAVKELDAKVKALETGGVRAAAPATQESDWPTWLVVLVSVLGSVAVQTFITLILLRRMRLKNA